MKELYTIGHSNHTIEKFLALLKQHDITALCDVRSHPYSKYNPQFTYKALKETLKKHNIAYVFLGNEWGGKPKDLSCYNEGKVQYARFIQTKAFEEGIRRLKKGIQSYRITLMCAEKEPLICHRMILIARYLRTDELNIQHILEDGRLETQHEAEQRLIEKLKIPQQDLFLEQQIEQAYEMQSQQIASQNNQKRMVQEEDEDYEADSTVHDWLHEENGENVF
jgi:uncharacterized protein (DUF488 family)